MNRRVRNARRDSRARAQRQGLLRYDVSSLPMPHSSQSTLSEKDSVGSSRRSDAEVAEMISAALDARLPAWAEAHVPEIVQDHLRAHVAAMPSLSETSASRSGAEDTSADENGALQPGRDAQVPENATSPLSKEPVGAGSSPTVRTVSRRSVSGGGAREDGPPSLARKASSRRNAPGLAARCLAHAGQHYRGATEQDVLDVWKAMRDRFELTPENKIVARRAFLDWLQRSRSVCASNVHWYGDFVAVRSCPVRLADNHPGHGVDGWFVLFDPNGESFMRSPLFSEAYETPDGRYASAVPLLTRPAWLSEDRRASAASRRGGADLRPFSPGTADELSAQDFFRGHAE